METIFVAMLATLFALLTALFHLPWRSLRRRSRTARRLTWDA